MLVLGGNFITPGNMTPLSEYNIWADPEASRIVLNAEVDKILVPLDICEDNRVADSMLTRDDIADMQAVAKDNAVVDMIADIFPIYIDIWREFFDLVGFPMDDVITVALAFAPDLVTMTEPLFVDVVLDEGCRARPDRSRIGAGKCCRAAGRRRRASAPTLDGQRFLRLFKDTMARYERAGAETMAAKPILFDCDPGHDDAIALVMAHRSPDIELLGVTTTCGNAEIEKTTSQRAAHPRISSAPATCR